MVVAVPGAPAIVAAGRVRVSRRSQPAAPGCSYAVFVVRFKPPGSTVPSVACPSHGCWNPSDVDTEGTFALLTPVTPDGAESSAVAVLTFP